MKKALSIFMLSLFTSVTAWAITGSGTESDPYVISSLSDWNTFASNVTGGTKYSGQYVKLGKNISGITTMVGKAYKYFCGTFDGNGKTLTVKISETAEAGVFFLGDGPLSNH